jgi:hypothetical protein
LQAWLTQTRLTIWPKLYPYLSPELVKLLKNLAEQDDSDTAMQDEAKVALDTTDRSGRKSS